jgi:hypothetical protein
MRYLMLHNANVVSKPDQCEHMQQCTLQDVQVAYKLLLLELSQQEFCEFMIKLLRRCNGPLLT